MPRTHTYKLGEPHVPEHLDGLKTATIRYGDERRVRPGDTIRFVTPDGEEIDRRRVTGVSRAAVGGVRGVLDILGAEYPDPRPGPLLSTLNGHYDDEIKAGTEVRVIAYEPEPIGADEPDADDVPEREAP